VKLDLAALLHPVSTATFFGEYWEEKPLLVTRNRPDYYASLLSIDDIDPLVTVLAPDTAFVTDSDHPIEVHDMVRSGSTLADASLDVVKASQLFAGGATVVVREADKSIASLAALSRELERDISAPFQTNLYMTPAGGKGFDTHYDTHDVFLLQIAGSKEWTIFDAPVRLPLTGQPFDASLHPIGAATMSFVLQAGDFLYIPRGFLHHARSREETSLHVTLGALCYRWADVVIEAMAQLCLADPAFRRALPVGFARADFDAGAARRTFADLMARAVAQASPDRVLDRIADEFVVSRRAIVPGQLAQAARSKDLSVMDEVGVRPAAIYRLLTEGDTLRVRAHGREISLAVEAADAVGFALASTRYRVRDLPGDLDEEEKLTLVKRLIDEGLLWKLSGG
jgi:ribosomal protein L16 Arg81 hydroxylase